MNFDQGVWIEESLSKPFFTYSQKYCQGDTVLNGHIYHKLYEFRLQETMTRYDTVPSHYIGAIRENDNKQVMFWGISDTAFTVIYDFNIELGDTLQLTDDIFVVNSIDSVEFCGRYHKRYVDYFYDDQYRKTLIEGVGYSNGLLGHHGFFHFGESYYILKCYTEWDLQQCLDCEVLFCFPSHCGVTLISRYNKIWSNLVYDYYSMEDLDHTTHFTRIEDEVRINDTLYFQLTRSNTEDMSDWYDYGYIREDTSLRLFYRKEESSNDVQLFDFGVELGDTVPSYDRYLDRIIEYRVDSICTISIAGVERKRMQMYSLLGGHITETWISGIGSMSGMPYNYDGSLGGDMYKLLCVNYGDSLLYSREGFASCYSSTVGVSDPFAGDELLEIYPNPVNQGQSVHVTVTKPLKRPRIELYNALGQQVNMCIPDSDAIVIEAPESAGLYFIRVTDKYELVESRKLIVH